MNLFLFLFKEAIHLDFYDLNYRYGKPQFFERTLLSDPTGLPRKGLWLRILVYFYKLFAMIRPKEWKQQRSIPIDASLFIVTSQNQRDSITPLVNELNNSILLGPYGKYPDTSIQFQAYVFSFVCFPFVLSKYLRSKDLQRLSYQYVFDQYWLSYGLFIAWRLWMRQKKPRVIVLSNDHNMEQRIIIRCAKSENIPVVYIQHASVSDEFPPLSMDFALLEGYDALRIYDQAGQSQTIVFLTGMAKADQYFANLNQKPYVAAIGICSNLFDPIQRVKELCKALRSALPDFRLVLRPHPGDKRKQRWMEIAIEYGMIFSDPKLEAAFTFLQGVDLIFAGNSNIHLEAALLNVYSIYYDYAKDRRLEKYTFVKTGLCEYIDDPNQALSRVKELRVYKPDNRYKAKSYCVTIGTPFDGKSTFLAKSIIQHISDGRSPDGRMWRRVSVVQLEAYEPTDLPVE